MTSDSLKEVVSESFLVDSGCFGFSAIGAFGSLGFLNFCKIALNLSAILDPLSKSTSAGFSMFSF